MNFACAYLFQFLDGLFALRDPGHKVWGSWAAQVFPSLPDEVTRRDNPWHLATLFSICCLDDILLVLIGGSHPQLYTIFFVKLQHTGELQLHHKLTIRVRCLHCNSSQLKLIFDVVVFCLEGMKKGIPDMKFGKSQFSILHLTGAWCNFVGRNLCFSSTPVEECTCREDSFPLFSLAQNNSKHLQECTASTKGHMYIWWAFFWLDTLV